MRYGKNIKNQFAKISPNFLGAIIIFVLVLAVYLFTLAPTIYIEDSPEYITAIDVLGIPHPTSYPLYVLLGKFFTLIIPLGSIAWKVNLMSAFWGALTCSLVYLICQRLVKSHFVSAVAALTLGFSEVFWSQSVVAEVYTLNTFFVALLILILTIWQEKKENKYLYWFAFLYGLSITNHEMMLLLAPIYAIFILLVDWQIIKNWRLILKMFLLFLLGFSVYLYLPLRGRQNPVLNWGHPHSLDYIWKNLTRKYYSDLSFNFDWLGKGIFLASFFIGIVGQFYAPFLILASLGLISLFFKDKKIACLTLGIFLLNSVGIFLLRGLAYGPKTDYIYRVYYLPCYIILSIWLAVILKYLYQKVAKMFSGFIYKILIVFISLIIIIYPASLLIRNYRYNNFSNFWLNYDYYKCVLESLPKNSVLLLKNQNSVSNDTEIFSLLYLQLVEKIRTDVYVMEEINLFYQKINIQLDKEYIKLSPPKQAEKMLELAWNFSKDNNFPFYASFPVNSQMAGLKLASKSNGAVYKVYPSLAAAKEDNTPYQFCSVRNLEEENYQQNFGIGDVIATIDYRKAFYYIQNNNRDLALKYLIRAINLDNEPLGDEYQSLIKARSEWQK